MGGGYRPSDADIIGLSTVHPFVMDGLLDYIQVTGLGNRCWGGQMPTGGRWFGKLKDVISEGLVLCASNNRVVEPLILPVGAKFDECITFSGSNRNTSFFHGIYNLLRIFLTPFTKFCQLLQINL
ncbi:hypothetical protein QVD17_35802 [Tagetes erecta]|uniref:Uncharacterized protein n=1 Tax=Tagetes erecta TaxID=13708 RepID=A0AAD8NIG5_TARER|nr:hypothetical protein QVD17_35802 [Tagetes erecta]